MSDWVATHYVVDLAAAGYVDAQVTVIVNPPGRVVRQWDDVVREDRGSGETDARWHEVMAQLLVSVRRGDAVTPLNSAAAVQEFMENDDQQILLLAVRGMWAERSRRLEAAKNALSAPSATPGSSVKGPALL